MDERQEHEAQVMHLSECTPEGMLRELLAVIHGDGGHRVMRVGLARATAEAMQRWHGLHDRQWEQR